MKRAGIPYRAIPAAGVHGVGLRALPRNLWEIGRGVLASRRILEEFKPEVLFFTGGYVGVPMALATRIPRRNSNAAPNTWDRPKVLLYVPDIEPGLALKTLARLADHIALTVEETGANLPEKVAQTVTGYPVRQELLRWDRASARQALGLRDDLPVLLVFGGSKGAHSINQALFASLSKLLEKIQVVHISGPMDWSEVQATQAALSAAQSAERATRYHAYPYLHEEMGAALAAADLVLSRAGASTLGEFPRFGLPAILAPYPYAWRYQSLNAGYLAERGAALILPDERLASELVSRVSELIGDTHQLDTMRQAMRVLAHEQAADSIAALLEDLVPATRLGRN